MDRQKTNQFGGTILTFKKKIAIMALDFNLCTLFVMIFFRKIDDLSLKLLYKMGPDSETE